MPDIPGSRMATMEKAKRVRPMRSSASSAEAAGIGV